MQFGQFGAQDSDLRGEINDTFGLTLNLNDLMSLPIEVIDFCPIQQYFSLGSNFKSPTKRQIKGPSQLALNWLPLETKRKLFQLQPATMTTNSRFHFTYLRQTRAESLNENGQKKVSSQVRVAFALKESIYQSVLFSSSSPSPYLNLLWGRS